MTIFDTDPSREDPKPTRADQKAFEELAATAHSRAVADAKTWRNAYGMLAGGLGALLGLIGSQLHADTPTGWRIALSVLFGGGLVAIGTALAMAVTIEGGLRTTSLNLHAIVRDHNSLRAYQVDQADAAHSRLDWSKLVAAVGALLGIAGLIVTLWLPGKASDTTPASVPATSQTSPTESSTTTPAPPTSGD
ncbi:hypothetical protein VX037_18680 [Gordonia sp. Z-3]|uniref:hypothetical protein n=1 Tax=Gordonia sp. Z-3 TaxID=3115408 RepID=UPI002E2A9A6F|nr:hypothetical protein [Gordonia sp. Z-3]MED5803054.1 hypothetical protein [Gordonia sp. Z-3]